MPNDAWIPTDAVDATAQLYTLDQIGTTRPEAGEAWQPTAVTGDATVLGLAASVALVAPAGIATTAVVGVVTSSVVAAVSGTASGTASATTTPASVTVVAPVGMVSGAGEATVAGVVSSVTVVAPAGVAAGDPSILGPTSSVTVSAPAGTSSGTATVAGIVVAVTTVTPAGVTQVATAGSPATLIAAAVAGSSAGGSLATAVVTAPSGAVSASASVGVINTSVGPGDPNNLEGQMITVTMTARSGSATGTNFSPVPGVVASITVATPLDPEEAAEGLAVDRASSGIQLTLLSGHVPYQPGMVRLAVADNTHPAAGEYTPEDLLAWLFLDGEQTSSFPVDLDPETFDNDKVLYPVDGLTVGAHTLTAGSSSTARDDDTTVTFYVDTAQVATGAATPQYPPAITSGRWTFQQYDFANLGSVLTYEFPTNPTELQETYAQAAVTADATTAYDGLMMVWEGERRPDIWTIKGEVFQRIDHDALAYWSSINQRLWVTDEFGRTVLAKITSFKAIRKRSIDYPWRHEYTMTFDVLDGPSVASFSGQFAEV